MGRKKKSKMLRPSKASVLAALRGLVEATENLVEENDQALKAARTAGLAILTDKK